MSASIKWDKIDRHDEHDVKMALLLRAPTPEEEGEVEYDHHVTITLAQ